MIPLAQLSHSSLGRIRIRIPQKRGDAVFFSSLAEKLKNMPDVSSLSVNNQTASVLILHQGETDAIFSWAKKYDLFEIEDPVEASADKANVCEKLKSLDGKVKDLTAGNIDLLTLSGAAGLLGLGVYQLVRGQVLAPASGLFIDAIKLILDNR
jgi:hypothetical protein